MPARSTAPPRFIGSQNGSLKSGRVTQSVYHGALPSRWLLAAPASGSSFMAPELRLWAVAMRTDPRKAPPSSWWTIM